jgi:hypothetical protein
MKQKGMYTTQLQAGLGLIQETRLLLGIWEHGMSTSELYQDALQSGQFPNISARRLRNVVVECFAPRYLISAGEPAQYLKRLNVVLSTPELTQLFFLYTSRANFILADFVREVYWERYAAGGDLVSNEDVKAFIRCGIDDGKTVKRWAESTIKRVSSYLTGCCADYGLLGKRTIKGRQIIPYRIEPRVAAYLAHDLHFAGLGDNAVTSHPDWKLFGVTRDDVREEFKRLSLKGHFIHQSAGSITHIGWKHKSIEEFVDVLTQG